MRAWRASARRRARVARSLALHLAYRVALGSVCDARPRRGAQVHLTPAAGKKVDHQGIKVELLGTIELFFDRGNTYDFVAMGAPSAAPRAALRWRDAQSLNPTTRAAPVRELEPPGEFSSTRSYAFEFNNVEMPYESYNGVNVRLK